jgi:ribosomal protein S12 methylthiotransferase
VRFVGEYGIARLGAFTYSPEQGTAGFDLADRVPADVARARYEAVLAERDRVLASTQRARVGSRVAVLVDEVEPPARRGAPATLVGRPESDAPEVDLIAIVRGAPAPVGALVTMLVEDVDAEGNLVGRRVEGA